MLQNIIAISIVAVAVIYAIYKILITSKKKKSCGGNCSCK